MGVLVTFLQHFVSGHFCDEFHEPAPDLDAGGVVCVLEDRLLFPLQLPGSRENVALHVELLVAQDIGHD